MLKRWMFGFCWIGCCMLFTTTTWAQKGAKAPKKAKAPQKAKLIKADQPIVKLLSAGKAPLKRLRYKFTKRHKLTMVMEMNISMRMAMKMGKATRFSPTIKTPPLQMMLEMTNVPTDAQGKTSISGKVVDIKVLKAPGVNPRIIQRVRQEVRKIRGLSIFYQINDRGFLLKSKIQSPVAETQQIKQVINNLRQSIRQMSTPLPAEPVGQGARWKVLSTFKQPLKTNQTIYYTLTKRAKDQMNVNTSVTQSAPPQTIQNNTPMGPVTNRVKYMHSSIRGKGTFYLSGPQVKAESSGRSEMKFRVTMRGQTRNMQLFMQIQSKFFTK